MQIGQRVAIMNASHGLGAVAGGCTGEVLTKSSFANGPMYLIALDRLWEKQFKDYALEGSQLSESELDESFRITEAKGLPNIGNDGRYGLWALPYEIVPYQ